MSDYISRQAVIDLVSKFIVEIISEGGRDLNAHTNDVLRQIVRNISSDRVLTSVENKGEWIPKERKTECSVDIDIVCSRCGYVGVEGYAHGYELNEIDMQEVRDYAKKLDMNFCTCCGADMKGEKEKKKFLCEWNIRAEIEAKNDIEVKRTFAEKLSNDFFTSVYPEDVKIVRGEET